MEPKISGDKELKIEDQSLVCGRCGIYVDSTKMELDEDEGIFLCPMCQAESISCGCSDELQSES